MKNMILCGVLGLSFVALTAEAQQVTIQGTGTQIRGKVLRTSNGQLVVQGPNNKEMIFYTNPKTMYYNNNQKAQFNAIQVGSMVNAWYGPPQEDKMYVNTVAILLADAPAVDPTAKATFYEGQVVRVVGQDQVVIKTAEGKEVTLYINPKTTYNFNDQPSTITNFQAGTPVRVEYYMQGTRPYARGILNRRNK